MKRAWILILMLLFFPGCGTIAFPHLNAPKPPDTVYDYEDTMKVTPKAIAAKGELYLLAETERTISVGYQKKEKKLTLMEKVGNWFSSLSFIAFILVIAGLFLAPGATIGFLLSLLKKWRSAATQTFRAIKESNATQTSPELKNALASKQSDETKKIVDKIKRSL